MSPLQLCRIQISLIPSLKMCFGTIYAERLDLPYSCRCMKKILCHDIEATRIANIMVYAAIPALPCYIMEHIGFWLEISKFHRNDFNSSSFLSHFSLVSGFKLNLLKIASFGFFVCFVLKKENKVYKLKLRDYN